MDQVDRPRSEPFAKWASRRVWQVASITLMVLSVALFVAVLVSNLQRPNVSVVLLAGMTAAFCIFSLLLAKVFLQLRRDQRNAASVLQTAAHEFQQMAGNIQEIFWMIDAGSKKALYVNQAYEDITGRSCQSLMESPSSYEDIIHPEDRVHVLGKLEEAAQNGQFNERFRIVRPGGDVRWVWARGFPVRDSEGKIRRLVGRSRSVASSDLWSDAGSPDGLRSRCASPIAGRFDPLLVRSGLDCGGRPSRAVVGREAQPTDSKAAFRIPSYSECRRLSVPAADSRGPEECPDIRYDHRPIMADF
jgi:PAS domain S-box-containing protein